MAITHILKDGSIVKDITGHVVRFEDAEPLYRFIHSLNLGGSVTDPDTYRRRKNEVSI